MTSDDTEETTHPGDDPGWRCQGTGRALLQAMRVRGMVPAAQRGALDAAPLQKVVGMVRLESWAGSHGGARDSARSEGESSQPVPVKGVGTLRPQPRRPRSQAEGPSRDDRVPLDITTRAFDGLEPAKAGRKPATMEPRRKRAYRVRVERPRRARKGGAPRPRVMSPAWSGGPRRCDVHTRKHANNCQDTRAGRRGATRTKTPP